MPKRALIEYHGSVPNWDELFKQGKFAPQEPTWGVRRFAAFLAKMGARRVLDLGCGAGRHLVFLAREGFEVHGLDASAEALKISRSRLRKENLSATLVRADMRNIPYPDGTFDAVIAIASLYHGTLADLRQTLAEIQRVLRPGGMALLEFKSKRSFRYGRGKKIEPETYVAETGEDAGILHHYSDQDEIERLLAGFVILEINHLERRVEGKWPSGQWEVWAKRLP
ncbi:MAG TPA: class I SAM-dependent methyltransferase [Candidatus Acetothermia bacterium]|nr:class I SAM-dependent methyltransferase [Candidatus Acetothermia bacterium]